MLFVLLPEGSWLLQFMQLYVTIIFIWVLLTGATWEGKFPPTHKSMFLLLRNDKRDTSGGVWVLSFDPFPQSQ